MERWIRVLLAAVMIAAGAFAGQTALATGDDDDDGTCYRIKIFIETDDNDVDVNGTLTVRIDDGDRVRFRDVSINANIDDNEREEVADFRFEDLEDEPDVDLDTSDISADDDIDFDVDVEGCNGPGVISDGRLNEASLGATAVIYENDQGGYDIFRINAVTGGGTRVIRVARLAVLDALAAATAPDGVNTLIAEDAEISLWALSSNECQMNWFEGGGKLNEFVFACPPLP